MSGALNQTDEAVRYSWQQTILDAFLSDPADLAAKAKIAEQAIFARLEESRGIDSSERTALEDGLRSLKVLAAEPTECWVRSIPASGTTSKGRVPPP